MDQEQIRELIKEYISQHLEIKIYCSSGDYWNDGPCVVVKILLDGEVVSSAKDSLPSQRFLTNE